MIGVVTGCLVAAAGKKRHQQYSDADIVTVRVRAGA
jgi:hypothetical protein